MKAKIPDYYLYIILGSFSLFLFFTWLFDEEPNEPIKFLIIIAGISALILLPLGIKFLKEDIDRQNRPRF